MVHEINDDIVYNDGIRKTDLLSSDMEGGGSISLPTRSSIEIEQSPDEKFQITSPKQPVYNVNPKEIKAVGTGPAPSEMKRPEGMTLLLLTTGLMFSVFIMSLDKSIIGK